VHALGRPHVDCLVASSGRTGGLRIVKELLGIAHFHISAFDHGCRNVNDDRHDDGYFHDSVVAGDSYDSVAGNGASTACRPGNDSIELLRAWC
jgi:hypothetical protein